MREERFQVQTESITGHLYSRKMIEMNQKFVKITGAIERHKKNLLFGVVAQKILKLSRRLIAIPFCHTLSCVRYYFPVYVNVFT